MNGWRGRELNWFKGLLSLVPKKIRAKSCDVISYAVYAINLVLFEINLGIVRKK